MKRAKDWVCFLWKNIFIMFQASASSSFNIHPPDNAFEPYTTTCRDKITGLPDPNCIYWMTYWMSSEELPQWLVLDFGIISGD